MNTTLKAFMLALMGGSLFVSAAKARVDRWTASNLYENIVVADCTDCEEDAGILIACTGNGQPANITVYAVAGEQGRGGEFADIIVDVDGQRFTRGAKTVEYGLVGFTPEFEVAYDDPLVPALQAGRSATFFYNGQRATIPLKGSRDALSIFKAHCGWTEAGFRQNLERTAAENPPRQTQQSQQQPNFGNTLYQQGQSQQRPLLQQGQAQFGNQGQPSGQVRQLQPQQPRQLGQQQQSAQLRQLQQIQQQGIRRLPPTQQPNPALQQVAQQQRGKLQNQQQGQIQGLQRQQLPLQQGGQLLQRPLQQRPPQQQTQQGVRQLGQQLAQQGNRQLGQQPAQQQLALGQQRPLQQNQPQADNALLPNASATVLRPSRPVSDAEGFYWFTGDGTGGGSPKSIRYAIPETDAVAFYASCEQRDQRGIFLETYGSFGNRPANSQVVLEIRHGAGISRYRGATFIDSEEYAGSRFFVPYGDPIWTHMMRTPQIAIGIQGEQPSTIPGTVGGSAIAEFSGLCR